MGPAINTYPDQTAPRVISLRDKNRCASNSARAERKGPSRFRRREFPSRLLCCMLPVKNFHTRRAHTPLLNGRGRGDKRWWRLAQSNLNIKQWISNSYGPIRTASSRDLGSEDYQQSRNGGPIPDLTHSDIIGFLDKCYELSGITNC
jgi:hypothetical protein